MDRLDGAARLMIVSDLDNTMVDHHDPDNLSLLKFNALWESHYRYNSILVFSTGRSPVLYKKLRNEKSLLTPDITIMSVGTEITYGELMIPDYDWEKFLNEKWNRDIVLKESSKFPQLSLQPTTEQRPHKISFYVEKRQAEMVMKSLFVRLTNRGLDVKLVYSGGVDLDVLPRRAGKGQALAYLLKKFKADYKQPLNTLVCGDSGNDAELFILPEVYGVMVSNAQEELLKWYSENCKDSSKILHASERCAAGIKQAICHFRLGPNTSLRDLNDLSSFRPENFNPSHIIVFLSLLYEGWLRAEVENSKTNVQNMKKMASPDGVLIHPSGVEQNLHEFIDALVACYGEKKGKKFRVWLDRVSSAQISSDAWLIKFHKWEMSDKGRQCCMTTALLNAKVLLFPFNGDEKQLMKLYYLQPETAAGFMLVHVHLTWMEGYFCKEIK